MTGNTEQDPSGALQDGIVTRIHLSHYFVTGGTKEVACALSTRLRKQLEYPEASPGSRRRRVQSVRRIRVVDPVSIGDRVRFEEGGGGKGMIMEVLPRRNKVSRRAAGASGKEQVLAANVDLALPVLSAADPPPEWELLDRMLAIAELQEIPAAICLNKLDLADAAEVRRDLAPYVSMGYRVVLTSVVDRSGRQEFEDLLRGGVSLLMGPSGVGKSTLVNWIQPGLRLRTAEVSETTGAGKHTTTHMELVRLADGSLVGDIPGVREFHLWDVQPGDLPHLYRDFRPYLAACQFRDCRHMHEPGCAVKQAVEDRRIDPRRYGSYLRLCEDP